MTEIGIESVIRGKKPGTTISDKALPCPMDRVHQSFPHLRQTSYRFEEGKVS
jgi:hypothetical protein